MSFCTYYYYDIVSSLVPRPFITDSLGTRLYLCSSVTNVHVVECTVRIAVCKAEVLAI